MLKKYFHFLGLLLSLCTAITSLFTLFPVVFLSEMFFSPVSGCYKLVNCNQILGQLADQNYPAIPESMVHSCGTRATKAISD